ncbi:glycosyl hydrolase family 28-related protein [Bacillus sp. V5-8f]|uniref:glycosyl hydrolase family 28-related protein n=1 Tax=Bacillus sp. V5-8f TaxID=2053044 RepID=UPI000C77E233|nr:glycosyl hydrolase family 28-related protein [Bacillus sp. V5-8f]PLT35603.1 pectate lyase [Bacillus sp. V5-8f]
MIYLSKTHNPMNNRKIIEAYTGVRSHKLKNAWDETDRLFKKHSRNYPVPSVFSIKSVLDGIKSMSIFLLVKSIKADQFWMGDTSIDRNGNIFPDWKSILDQESDNLLRKVRREVSVTDFGAVGDGATDNTEAFKKAIANGRVKVVIPEGTFVVKGLKLPSYTFLAGAGKEKTVLKLHDAAPKEEWLITNAHHVKGDRNIHVEGMSLDWNVERLGNVESTAAGNNRSSCLTFANVTFGWVKNVEAINPGLHCFDVSSTVYTYLGDGTRSRGGSKYIWLDNLNGYGFGDDGITTHHSDYIYITNSHMCDPSGRSHKKGFSNSNGIEVDDGSRNVWLVNNSTARCFGGVEIKAHHNASAASNVVIIGHLSVNDNRSYNFRHIGHHKQFDPESKTAFNIKAMNIVSIAPIYTDLYQNSTPRGMVVSAYKNVAVNHFTLLGDPDYDYKGEPVIAIQYRARNVAIKNVKLHGFKNAGAYIKVFGGEQRADNVSIQNVHADKQAAESIDIGASIESANVENINIAEKIDTKDSKLAKKGNRR